MPSDSQLDAVQWRMLCAIARDAVVAASTYGSETVAFHGYRVAARRVEIGNSAAIEVTLSLPPSAASGHPTAVRTEVASPVEAGTASVIAWRCACGRVVCAEVPSAG
ncbi:MAG: hypothetical protein R3E87_08995 [Burkholderiaceae bacterium]